MMQIIFETVSAFNYLGYIKTMMSGGRQLKTVSRFPRVLWETLYHSCRQENSVMLGERQNSFTSWERHGTLIGDNTDFWRESGLKPKVNEINIKDQGTCLVVCVQHNI